MSRHAARVAGRLLHVCVCIIVSAVMVLTPPLRFLQVSGVLGAAFFEVGLTSAIGPDRAYAADLPVKHVSGTISTDTTWTASSLYVVDSSLTVSSAATLTVDPGVIVKVASGFTDITVNGTLRSSGTAGSPVIFTSLKDDAHGGDTNGDGTATTPAPGAWGNIHVTSTAAGLSMTQTQVLYGGCGSNGAVWISGSSASIDSALISASSNYGVYVEAGVATLTNSTLSECPTGVRITSSAGQSRVEGCTLTSIATRGISVEGGSPIVAGNTFTGACADAAIRVFGAASAQMQGNTGSGFNHRIVLAGQRTASLALTKQALPYVLDSTFQGPSRDVTLTVDAGVVIKVPASGMFGDAYGAILANGSESDPVVFTSIKDDAHGGDTNNDASATSPAPGDWSSMSLSSNYATSSITNAEVLYAGGYYGAVCIESSTPTLRGVRVSKCSGNGIYINNAAPLITGCTISGNGGAGITGWPLVATVVSYSDICGNGTTGDNNLDLPTGRRIDARHNYWGRTSGPRVIEKTNAQCEPWLWYSIKTPKSAQVYGGNTPCGRWGEPVNTSTGNFYYSASDLVLPGVGPAIGVGRTYNHQDASSKGVLGYGWTLDCESFVQPRSDGSALVVYPGGSRKTFTPDGSGGYIAPQGTLEKLATGQSGGFTLTFTDRTVNTYSASGALSYVTDRYGNAVAYTRNSLGAITRIEASGGRYIDFTYTGDLLTKISDNAGRQVTYAYSAAGDLSTVTDPAGGATTYACDSQHRVTAVASAEHPAEPFVSHTYDAANRVSVQHDSYDSTGTLSYEASSTAITNNRGFAQIHRFDSEYRLMGETDGAGHTDSRTYNAAGLIASATDAKGHANTFSYDTDGNQTGVTDAAGHASSASYDMANNNILWSEDAEGVRTTYSYDASGTALVSVANPVFTTTFEHYANGLLKSATRAGATVRYGYDAAGRLTSVTDSLSATSTVSYDATGNVTATTDALGRATSFTYDAAGRVLSATDPAGETSSFAYDKNGNRTSATDALGKTTRFTYDVMDKLAGVTDPLSNAWSFAYDRNYNLSSVTNPRGATTGYTYSASDRLTSTEDALGHVWGFTYDAAGNQVFRSTPTSATVTSTYTDDDLLATSSYSTGESYAFAYTPAHRLTSVTDGSGRGLAFAYNPVGWLTSASDTTGGSGFATTYSYDSAGRVTGVRASTEATRSYAFDLAGRLTSLTSAGATATFTSDATGARTGVSLGNGAVSSYRYDAAGRIESIVTTATSGVIAETYARDAAGRVVSDSQGSYAYDDAGRLVSWRAQSAEATTTYAYDAASNLTGIFVGASPVATFTVDAADRITSPGFSYDAAGNLTSDGRRLFAYDAASRLTCVKDASTETTIAVYAYDAFNRRISSAEGTSTVFFHYDGASSRVIAETDATGTVLASYTYDSGGALFSMTRAGATYYYHTNARGDVVAMSDSQGVVVNTYAYDPWGKLLAASETVANPYRYASYRFDTATGLSYCWNRYYAPALARFLTRDIYPGELTDPVTMNPYLYCGGDPVNAVDPSGLLSINSWKAIGLGVAAVGLGIASVALIVGSGGAATPLVAAAALSFGGMIAAGLSLDTTERQWQAGEISPAEYKMQKTLGWWGMGVSAASGAAACAGAPIGVQAYMAVHGLNVATVGLALSSAQGLRELTR